MTPTRNSSSSGRSSGPSSARLAGATAGTDDFPPLLRSSSSSSSSRRSASRLHLDLLEDHAGDPAVAAGLQVERALPRLADRPGDEPLRWVVCIDRHGPYPPAPPPTAASVSRRAVTPDRVGSGLFRLDNSPAGVIHPQQERAQRRIADRRERARVDLDPLQHVDVHAEAVRDDGLDHVTVGADHVGRLGPEPGFQSRTALTARCCMSMMDSPSSPGNRAAPGCAWTTRHSGSLASCLQWLAGPVPVVALAEPLVFQHLRGAAFADGGYRVSGLPAPLQRAADDRVQRQRREPRRESPGLLLAPVIQWDARRPAGQDAAGGRRQAMAHQENQGHAPTLRGADGCCRRTGHAR